MKLNFFNRAECEPFIISTESTIEDALIRINQNGGIPCLVLDDRGKCIDLLTDGDLRRLMLQKHPLQQTISSLIDGSVQTATGIGEQSAREQMESRKIRYLPVTDEDGLLAGMWAFNQTEDGANLGAALILAGGEGKRLRPITQKVPKPLVPVGGLALLDRSIEACISHGVKDIFVSVNYLADQIIDHLAEFSNDSVTLTVLRENEPLGTAGPIGLVDFAQSDSLIVINGDLLHKVNLTQMKEHFISSGADILVGSRLYDLSVPFGVLETQGTSVIGITEKPVLSFPVSAGIYVVSQRAGSLVGGARRVDMPELIYEALEAGFHLEMHMIHEFWLDVGTPEALQIAQEVVESGNF